MILVCILCLFVCLVVFWGIFFFLLFSLLPLGFSCAAQARNMPARHAFQHTRRNLCTWAHLTSRINEASWRLQYVFHRSPPLQFDSYLAAKRVGRWPWLLQLVSKSHLRGQELKFMQKAFSPQHTHRCSFILHAAWAQACLKRAAEGSWEVETRIHLADTSGGRRRNALLCSLIIVIIIYFTLLLKKRENQRFL